MTEIAKVKKLAEEEKEKRILAEASLHNCQEELKEALALIKKYEKKEAKRIIKKKKKIQRQHETQNVSLISLFPHR